MPDPYFRSDGVELYLGDCREVLAGLADNSVDAVATDPPYELGFMGRAWDASGIAFDPTVWRECLRVLKPGGHLVAFGGTRTWHRLAVAVEDAGFDLRDTLMWIYGSGFPKSLDVSKAIDKAAPRADMFAGFAAHYAECRRASGLSHREICETGGFYAGVNHGGASTNWERGYGIPTLQQWAILSRLLGLSDDWLPLINRVEAEREVIAVRSGRTLAFSPGQHEETRPVDLAVTVPATDGAARWTGWGTALKPGWEPIILARKPLAGTVAANVLEYGTGALNIDACRVPHNEPAGKPSIGQGGARRGGIMGERPAGVRVRETDAASTAGRWPTNLVFSHSASCVENGPCEPDCPVAELDRQSGSTSSARNVRKPVGGVVGNGHTHGRMVLTSENVGGFNDSGGASRFFPVFRYEAKASSAERPKLARQVMRLRSDLTDEQRAHVLEELRKAGVNVG